LERFGGLDRLTTMSDPPDDELLAASQRDPAAFEAVFDRYFAVIHRYVRHRLGASAADDVAAETFAKAFAARHRARTVDGSLRAWLYAIAGNLITDELRARQRAGRADADLRHHALTTPDRATAWAADPTGHLHRNPDLTAAVLALRDEEREALLLLAWGELSYQEIAAATGVATGTARTRVHRARAALRARLQPEAPPAAACAPGSHHLRTTEH
jgi:RNA polymerase sigma factor (sigma-70 family)